MSVNAPGQLSPDGKYMWDGRTWVSAISPDGTWRWDGGAWVPHGPDIPGLQSGPTFASPPGATPIPGTVPPPGYAGYRTSRAAAAGGLGFQFGGSAAWSIGFGLAAILLPLVTLSGGHVFYFVILPIFGLIRGITAIRAGRLGGGITGVVLNVIGGFMSLLASGLIG